MGSPVGTEVSADAKSPETPQLLPVAQIEALQAQLSAMLRKRGAHDQDIPDFIQQGFLAFAEGSRESVIRNPGGYVYTSASNAFLADCQKRNSLVYDSRNLNEASGDAWSGREPQNDRSYDALDCEPILHRIERRLSAKHVRAFVLVSFFGHSHQEAAQMTGITPSTVKKYIDEVRVELKAYRSNNDGRNGEPAPVGGGR